MKWQGRSVREMQLDLIVRRLAEVKASTGGRIPTGHLVPAMRFTGLSGSQLKRRVRTLDLDTGRSLGSQPTFAEEVNADEVLVALFQHSRCISAAYRTLTAAGSIPPCSVRTLERYVRDHLDPALVSASKLGYRGLVEQQMFNTEVIPHRGYAYSLDPKDLPLKVVMRRGWHSFQPDLTLMVDMATRFILAYLLTVGAPSTDDLITLFADAVAVREMDDGTLVGGKPQFVRSDRGGQFISEAWQRGLLRMEAEQQLTDPYSSWQNGISERKNREVDGAVASLPGYYEGGWGSKETRVLRLNQPDESLLTFDQLDLLIGRWITQKNSTPSRSLHGLAPLQAWALDEAPLVDVGREALLLSMMHRVKRVVQGDGVQLDYAVYQHPKLYGHKREVVDVASFRHDREHVEIFADGKHICRAPLAAAMPRHLQMQVVTHRKRTVEKFRHLTAQGLIARVVEAREALTAAGIPEDELPEIPVFTSFDSEDTEFDTTGGDTVAVQASVIDDALAAVTKSLQESA